MNATPTPLNIKRALAQEGITIDAAAAVIGVHRNSMSNKLDGVTAFSIRESFTLKRELLPQYDLDWLFSPIVKPA